MNIKKNLREHCHVNKNGEGDSFVGIKADTEDIVINFPIGYQLPPNDESLRADIFNLISVLSSFMKEENLLEDDQIDNEVAVKLPMHAYIKVIRDYLRTGRYYTETEHRFKTDTKGNASWSRTLKEQRSFVQKNGALIFTKMTVRSINPNTNKKITQIHRYCVYEAFEKLGWLYVPYMPEKPGIQPDKREAIYILEKKLASTHNDIEHELFSAMISILQFKDEKSSSKKFFFGTDFFERIWEKMIDKAFGIENKEKYFPRTKWILDYGINRIKTPLQPDSIMIYKDKFYVLDAKLYRYGYSGNPDHLPNGQDINKQITYAEYIERAKGVPDAILDNAFIMPFNCEDNPFHDDLKNKDNQISNSNCIIKNIGEAIADWKPNPKKYERIQGIVIDTRFLMYNYITMADKYKSQLVSAIEKVNYR